MSEATYVEAVDPFELAELVAQWGAARRTHVRLEVDHPFLTAEPERLTKDGRRAEICYVMQRAVSRTGAESPAGRGEFEFLLHIKRFYPRGAFRLPTGGIHQGERVMDTLAREIEEETSMTVGSGPGQVRVERFLGTVAYELAHRSLGEVIPFATYHFLVSMPPDGAPVAQDEEEEIEAWEWCPRAGLDAVADVLARVGEKWPDWADWGRYRAVSHRFVAQALTQDA